MAWTWRVFGRSVGLLAFAPGQFLRNHGNTGAIGADIHDGNRSALAFGGLGLSFLPLLGGLPDALDHTLDLAG